MARQYVEVSITGDHGLTDHLVALLSQLGFEGFWEEEGILRGYISGDRWLPGLEDEIERVVMLVVRAGSTPRPNVTVRRIENRNWNAEWEQTIRPIRAS